VVPAPRGSGGILGVTAGGQAADFVRRTCLFRGMYCLRIRKPIDRLIVQNGVDARLQIEGKEIAQSMWVGGHGLCVSTLLPGGSKREQ